MTCAHRYFIINYRKKSLTIHRVTKGGALYRLFIPKYIIFMYNYIVIMLASHQNVVDTFSKVVD